MEKRFDTLFSAVEKHRDLILEAERHIWKNPESGFREWKTHEYLKRHYLALGYELTEAGNIPGFYVDIDTGRPGPRLAIFGEMDSLIVASHPESDPETGAVHACGHNCQSAALLGIAAALKEPGALDGLCGSIRLLAVPAEEGIEIGFRRELREKGIIRYLSGKLEFLYRGYLDGVDLAMMVHTSPNPGLSCPRGANGSMTKIAAFHGTPAHAGGSPHLGNNALYAATTAMSAANALRETFRDEDHVRWHPILTRAGKAVNAIPDEVISESYVRGANVEAIKDASAKTNRAYAGCAAAMNCTVTFYDEHGYGPVHNDENLREAYRTVGRLFFPEDQINVGSHWGNGCTDMGDISCVMPAIHPSVAGATGRSHSDTYYIADPVTACVTGAKIQLGVTHLLLSEDAALAKKVILEAEVPYASKEAYFATVDALRFEGEGVVRCDDGTLTLRFRK